MESRAPRNMSCCFGWYDLRLLSIGTDRRDGLRNRWLDILLLFYLEDRQRGESYSRQYHVPPLLRTCLPPGRSSKRQDGGWNGRMRGGCQPERDITAGWDLFNCPCVRVAESTMIVHDLFLCHAFSDARV